MQTLRMTIAAAGIFLAASDGRAQMSPVLVEGIAPTARVSYADLDLTSPAGRLTLNRRVTDAAANLCLDNQRVVMTNSCRQMTCESDWSVHKSICGGGDGWWDVDAKERKPMPDGTGWK